MLFSAIPGLGWGENAQLGYVLLLPTIVEARREGALVSAQR